MFLVGLTGGIASGKSSVIQVFQQLGCAVIDVDIIARHGEWEDARLGVRFPPFSPLSVKPLGGLGKARLLPTSCLPVPCLLPCCVHHQQGVFCALGSCLTVSPHISTSGFPVICL